MANTCLHCQSPIPPTQTKFCCNGCAAAYSLIHNMGLSSYYTHRTLSEKETPLIPEEYHLTGIDQYITTNEKDISTLHLMVSGLHCAACVWLIETVLNKQNGITHARMNMTTRRLTISWNATQTTAQKLIEPIFKLGYSLLPYDPTLLNDQTHQEEKRLLIALAIAGFAAANVMLLSVGLWAGGKSLPTSTLSLLQYFSALIVLPATIWAGRPFFISAITALKYKRLNMDVPISLAVIITLALSLYDMVTATGETYFESTAMLLFFLLIGRYLDMRVRNKAQHAAEQLASLQAKVATRIQADGSFAIVPLNQLNVGDVLFIAKGESIPADGRITQGTTVLDSSILTGESLPQTAQVGSTIYAGCLNLENPIHIEVTHIGDNTNLAQITKLVEQATSTKNTYTILADKVAQLYAPIVHILALATFLLWWLYLSASFHTAVLYATSVLIITCPCALALAVPAVQVVVVSRLLRLGILIKSGSALERLKETTAFVFDKTGTLTTGKFTIISGGTPQQRKLAAQLAKHSQHPLAQAVAKLYPDTKPLEKVTEITGQGLTAIIDGKTIKLGNASFCEAPQKPTLKNGETDIWLKVGDDTPILFTCADTLRPDAEKLIHQLKQQNYPVYLLSGDTEQTVQYIANKVNISEYYATRTPQQKYDFLKKLEQNGHRILMCGDGINDAPSLACAHISLTLSSSSQIAQTQADIILQQEHLLDILIALNLAQKAHKTAYINIALSFAYNAITIPLAMAGFITPLWAAVFMSLSSLTVTLNALRLSRI